MARCFVTRWLPGPALDRLAQEHEVDAWPERLPPRPEELRERAREAEGLLCLLTDRIDADLIDACPRLRVISNYAVGSDNVDLRAAAKRGIPVGVTPDVLTETTADLAFALVLAAARRLVEADAFVHAGDWVTWEPGRLLGRDVHGRTLGIVGLGRIGRAVARRAEGFAMTVVHTSSSGGVPLPELLAASDFVSIHCPLTSATRGLIDEPALRRMKPTAALVNTARGAIVDSEALAGALRRGWIAAAALDVTDPEPLPADHALLAAPNLTIVPHIGSATHETREVMAELAVDNLLAGLAGRALPAPAPPARANRTFTTFARCVARVVRVAPRARFRSRRALTRPLVASLLVLLFSIAVGIRLGSVSDRGLWDGGAGGGPATDSRAARAGGPAVPSELRLRNARRFAHHRSGHVSLAVVDSRGRLGGTEVHRSYPSASITKAMLLVAYLRQLERGGLLLGDSERALIEPMIRISDNAAASEVQSRLEGGEVQRLAQAAGMRDFAYSGDWANARVTAADQARFFGVADRLVPRSHRRYARRLLASVIPQQSWGIPAVAESRWTVFFKGGWRPTPSGNLVHQGALLEHDGRRVSIAVLSDANPTDAYGRATVRGIATRLLGRAGAAR